VSTPGQWFARALTGRAFPRASKAGVSRFRNVADDGQPLELRHVMTPNPTVCYEDTPLIAAAREMIRADCGALPVVRKDARHPIGIITDRDIVCRAVAEAKAPETPVGDIMTSPPVTAHAGDSLKKALMLMKEHQVRRILIVDDRGMCCGVVSQADVVKNTPADEIAELINDISEPIQEARRNNS
jgi:CBS domain-containing protein